MSTQPVVVVLDDEPGTVVLDPPAPQGERFIVVGQGYIPALSHRHVQDVPTNVWTVTHGLTFRPNVAVVDSGGREVEGDVRHVDNLTVEISFSQAFAGEAYLS